MTVSLKSASHLAGYLRKTSRRYQLDLATKSVENYLAVEVWDKGAGRASTIRVWLPDEYFHEYRWGPAGRDGWSAQDGEHHAESWIPMAELAHQVLSQLAELTRPARSQPVSVDQNKQYISALLP